MLAALEPAERRALLAEAWRLRTGRVAWMPLLRGARHVHFVCHGNIIRSPFAARRYADLVRGRTPAITVTSGGVEARTGEPADARAVASAAERGTDLRAHRATRLDAAHVRGADAIVVMDLLNLGRVLGRFPHAAGKTVLLAGCAADGRLGLAEIHDPVAGTLDDVRRSHAEVEEGVQRLVAALDAR